MYVWFNIWTLYSVPLIDGSVLVPVPNCFDYCGFVVEFEVGEVEVSALFFLLRTALAIWGLLWFHMNFRTICSSLLKNAVNILRGIALNL